MDMASVLIIDDDPDARGALKGRLEALGYATLEAANAEEGLQLARHDQPALIFLDVMMPKMDGWMACRILKGDPVTKSIPVAMITARAQQIEELRCWESGADAYIAKPWESNQISEILKKFIPHSQKPA